MKFLIAFSCFVAATIAKPSGVGLAPAAVSYAAPAPVAYAAPAPIPYAPRAFSYSVATYTAPAPIALAAPAPAPAPASVAYAAPAPVAAPVAYAAPAPVPAPVVKSQYHAQDELGQASYGHAEPYQAHNAVQDAAGNKIGSYSYVAPNGQVISANYIADALGYRVTSNALPAAPVAVAETPEVSAARAAHLAEYTAAKSRARRSVATPLAYTASVVPAPAPLAYTASVVPAPAPLAYTASVVPAPAPLAYAAPAAPLVRAAELTTIVNNPGHAVSYRVD